MFHTLFLPLPQGLHPDFPGQSSIESLGTVEHFFLEVMNVPRPEERLSVLIFMRSYEPGVQQLRNLVSLITEPAARISSSADFALLLRMVLEVSVGDWAGDRSLRCVILAPRP